MVEDAVDVKLELLATRMIVVVEGSEKCLFFIILCNSHTDYGV